MGKKLDKFFIIVNLNSGSGKTKKDWEKINYLLSKSNIIYDVYFTKKNGDAVKITIQAVEKGYRKFISVGGDGTLNELINGLFIQKFCKTYQFIVGIIPVGTGNDWCRYYNFPKNYHEAIKIIENQNLFVQDVGVVEISGRKQYFINVAGIGFDALVAHKTNIQKQKGKGSKFSFLFNIFSSIKNYKAKFSKIIANENSYEIELFSMNVGICKYNGGGMMQLPNAVSNDGLFDVTIIKKISFFDLMRNIKKLYDGNILKHPKVINFKTDSLSVINNNNLLLETDGENVEIGNYNFSIIPNSIKMIIPDLT